MLEDDSWAHCAALFIKKRQRLVLAESCTGGLLASTITEAAGASTWFEGSLVTYSNEAKIQWLGVDAVTLAEHGAVSVEVAEHMVGGALQATPSATVAASITGIAGPEGGSEAKPVGTVCFAFSFRNQKPVSYVKYFKGDRQSVRQQALAFVCYALGDGLASGAFAVV
jgi:nicotinamide-nucleotide amidase